jgi:hypothetical protein
MRGMQALASVVVGGLIGGIFALAGVLLGPWLKARGDLAQWQREQRIDAYSRMDRAVFEVFKRFDAISAVDPGGIPIFDMDWPGLLDKAKDEVILANSRIQLLGRPGVRAASQELHNYIVELTNSMLFGDSTEGENDQNLAEWVTERMHDSLANRYRAFMEAARHDLDVR